MDHEQFTPASPSNSSISSGSNSPSGCGICLRRRSNHVFYQCDHSVCTSCNEGIFPRTCPFCRAPIPSLPGETDLIMSAIQVADIESWVNFETPPSSAAYRRLARHYRELPSARPYTRPRTRPYMRTRRFSGSSRTRSRTSRARSGSSPIPSVPRPTTPTPGSRILDTE
jgi:hypothetical protein